MNSSKHLKVLSETEINAEVTDKSELVQKESKKTDKVLLGFFIFYYLPVLPLIALISLSISYSDAVMFSYFFLSLFAFPFTIIATVLYIFYIQPRKRYIAYFYNLSLLIFCTIVLLIGSLSFSYTDLYAQSSYVSSFIRKLYSLSTILLFYGLANNFWLKTTLLFYDKPIKVLLFKGEIERSPAEMEWRKYNKRSGTLALVLGFLLLQPLWLVYHFLIRPSKVRKTKIRLIIESLDFEEEANTTTIALELGVPLEEVIYYLKKLNLKQEIIIEQTRYGVILKEIRASKWFTPKMKEKYELYLVSQKRSELEIHASKILDLAERERLKERQFRKVMRIKEDYPLDDLLLLLPPHTIMIKKPLFSKERWIYFNREEMLRKREKIILALVEHASEIFDIKS